MEGNVPVSTPHPYHFVALDVGRIYHGHSGTARLRCVAGILLNFIHISYLLLLVRDTALVLFMDHHLVSNSVVLSSFMFRTNCLFFIFFF